MLVLEEYEHARARGATIHAEVVGYGNTGDCYRVTDPHPDGVGAEKAMRNALKDAGLAPDQIGHPGEADVLVVRAELGLGRGREQGLGPLVGLAPAFGQGNTAQRARALVVLPPLSDHVAAPHRLAR